MKLNLFLTVGRLVALVVSARYAVNFGGGFFDGT
jgi:hypothetical protein